MITNVDITHFHLFCGLGGGAAGFNRGHARVGSLVAKFRCLGGVDVDPAAISDFGRLAGVPGTVLDMFSREQYCSFHGKEPPTNWREAMPVDIRIAAGNERPNIVFLSAPCKGFSGLLSETRSRTDKYQALNGLTLRGVWLMLEAWSNDPPELIVFENVPRIANRGRALLDQIGGMLRQYGYAVAETTHDCGELGGLAQSRKRFLLVARHVEKVQPFLYEPSKKALRAVGDVLGKFPLPGDSRGGPMHRIPSLQWKTWVRLAFVEAGSDWRSLKRLAVENGNLRDYLLVPENVDAWHPNVLGVNAWGKSANTITSESRPTTGRFSVADPRAFSTQEGSGFLGVRKWGENTGAVTANGRPGAGAFSVADVRFDAKNYDANQYGVIDWAETTGTIINVHAPGQGRYSVADPRINGHAKSVQMGVRRWDQTAGVVTGKMFVGGGPNAVADHRQLSDCRHKVYRVVRAPDTSDLKNNGARCSGDGHNVPDVRYNWNAGSHHNKMAVVKYNGTSKTVTGSDRVGSGALSVADPRPNLDRSKGDHYLTGGHYGVIPWNEWAYSVTGCGRHDNGHNNVADPRLPNADERVVVVIRAEDGTWHRPFTTLELAALQSLVDPEEYLELEGLSDSAWRERIGNAVPRDAATEIASVMGHTLLLSMSGETFVLSATPVWVRNVAIALAVKENYRK